MTEPLSVERIEQIRERAKFFKGYQIASDALDLLSALSQSQAEVAEWKARHEAACQKIVRLEVAQAAETWGDNDALHNRIAELEAAIEKHRDICQPHAIQFDFDERLWSVLSQGATE